MEKILLATSIAPCDIELQQQAVDSWLESGFDVVSCNAAEEVAVLRQHFPRIRFVTLSRDARDLYQKPYPYIYDLMQVLKREGGEVVGIINSDIHLRFVTEGMLELIRQEAKGGILYNQRIDVESISHIASGQGTVYRFGLDLFFFDRRVLDCYRDEGYCIGQPVWDYWIFLDRLVNGGSVRELLNTISFHVCHPVRWNYDATVSYCDRLLKSLFPVPETLLERLTRVTQNPDTSRCLVDEYFQEQTNQVCGNKVELVTLLSKFFLFRISDGVCFVDEAIKNKTVLAVVPPLTEQSPHGLQPQTHEKVRFVTALPPQSEIHEDYVLLCPDGYVYSNALVDCMLQDMKSFSMGSWQLPLFLYEQQGYSLALASLNVDYGYLRKMNEAIPHCVLCETGELSALREKPPASKLYKALAYLDFMETDAWGAERGKLTGRLVLFPCGQIGKMVAKQIRARADLVAFLDNDPEKQGQTVLGIPVHSPEFLKKSDAYDRVVIAVGRDAETLYRQAITMAPEERVIMLNLHTV